MKANNGRITGRVICARQERLHGGTIVVFAPAGEAQEGLLHERVYRFAGWVLSTGARKLVSPAGERVDLTNGEYALLLSFLKAPRQILSRDQLLEGSRMHDDIYDRSIDVQILRLRRKIESDSNEPTLIKTERGAGYVFDCDVAG